MGAAAMQSRCLEGLHGPGGLQMPPAGNTVCYLHALLGAALRPHVMCALKVILES